MWQFGSGLGLKESIQRVHGDGSDAGCKGEQLIFVRARVNQRVNIERFIPSSLAPATHRELAETSLKPGARVEFLRRFQGGTTESVQ